MKYQNTTEGDQSNSRGTQTYETLAEPNICMSAFHGPDGRPDAVIAAYAFGLAASFGISHLDAIHYRLLRWMPSTYSSLNVALPCGRALFLLAILQRGAANQERAAGQAARASARPPP